jgi:hypothetical protein
MDIRQRITDAVPIFLIILLSLAGCSNNEQLESLPKTMAALTQQAMYVAPVTYTPAPTETPTITPFPSDTPTITVTPTPDFTDFTRVTPAAARLNAAVWRGINFKFKKVINNDTFVIVTFSDGVKQKIFEGWEKKGGALKGFYASEKTDTVGEVDFFFNTPADSMDVIEVKIAESAEAKDKAVVLYTK